MGNSGDTSPYIPSLSQFQIQLSTEPNKSSQSLPGSTNLRRKPPEESVSLTADKYKYSNLRRHLSLVHPLKDQQDEEADHRLDGEKDTIIGSGVAEGVESDDKTSEEEPLSRGSAESKTTRMSTAEDWFKDFNRDVQLNNSYSAYDDDPPYYLPNASLRRKHHLTSRHQRPNKLSKISSAGGRPTGVGDLDPQSTETTSESNSDSYRSVIDDLTIKNQKLKRRLRRLEELQAEHLQTDKLFELRIHGLSSQKRQELESLLQTFASTLHSPSAGSSGNFGNSPGTTTNQDTTSPIIGHSIKPASGMHTTDSAYASGSGGSSVAHPSSIHPSIFSRKPGSGLVDGTDTGNGNGSGSRSGSGSGSGSGNRNGNGIGSGSGNGTRNGNGVESGTGTSGGNSSPTPGVVSEKAKMKLVVKRLEQLFTGRASSFARSRQFESNAGFVNPPGVGENIEIYPTGPNDSEEGTREASLMYPRKTSATGSDVPKVGVTSSDLLTSADGGLDQRPTRPIDLDPRRAQIPEDNLEYLHNLTSSSANEPVDIGGQWDGWVYLNLITNLAQLHTINVTLPFVKKAIATMSTKLELSPDGKMVRWKGGNQGSQLSSESGSRSGRDSQSEGSPSDGALSGGKENEALIESNSESAQIDGTGVLNSNEMKTSMNSSSKISENMTSGSGSGTASRGSRDSFHYKPLFARSRSSDEDSSDMETSSSLSSSEMMKSRCSFGNGDGLGQTGSCENSGDRGRRPKKFNVGPIIYYENGNFCTDLSTQDITMRDASATPDYPYERMTHQVVGIVDRSSGYYSLQGGTRPLFEASHLETVHEDTIRGVGEDGELVESDLDESLGIQFSPKLNSTMGDHPPLPVELEASGIGGVLPYDNFAINVQTKHYILPKGKSVQAFNARKLKARLRGIMHRIPQSSIDVFTQDENSPTSTRGPTSSPRTNNVLRESSPPRLNHELVSARYIRLPPSTLPPPGYMYFSPSSDESSRDSDSGILPKSGSRSFYSEGLDMSMRDGMAGGVQNEPSQLDMVPAHGRRFLMEHGMGHKNRKSGSVGSGRVVVGRERVTLDDNVPDSSAATAGSGIDSSLPSRVSSPILPRDSDESMEDVDGDTSLNDKSSDDYLDGVEEDEYEDDDESEEQTRPNLKRSRNSKGSVDSLLATRKS